MPGGAVLAQWAGMLFARRISIAFALVAIAAAGVAHAEAPRLAALTKAYADKHALPVRVVKNDLGTRQVERHFVPVLPTTHDDFLTTFQEANGAVVWRARPNDPIHGVVYVGPGETISHPNRHQDAQSVLPQANGGLYVTLAVNPAQLASWGAFIDEYTPAGAALYGQPNSGNGHFEKAMLAAGKQVYGGCMWWVVNADLGGVNLAHVMGVRRAKGPEVLAPRLIHAGNELVGPIGVAVPNLEAFNAMSDQQLMGPEPAGGAAEQVKE